MILLYQRASEKHREDHSIAGGETNVSKQYHIGLVGCGDWGRYILRDLNSLGCRVTAVARSEQSRKNARDGKAASIVNSIDQLPDIDGAVVASPTSSHAAVIEELLDRQIPIYVEKPLTNDPKTASRLVKIAGDRIFVMDKWRHHPGIELLAEIARSGELGRVLGLRSTRVSWGNHHEIDCIWIYAPHDIAIAYEVLGYLPKPRSAMTEKIGDTPVGLVGLLGDNPWFVFEASIRYRERRRDVRLHCENGIAVLADGYSDHIQITRVADFNDTKIPEPELRPISTEFPLLRELRAFVEYLDGGPPPKSSAPEGAAMVQLIADLRKLAGISD